MDAVSKTSFHSSDSLTSSLIQSWRELYPPSLLASGANSCTVAIRLPIAAIARWTAAAERVRRPVSSVASSRLATPTIAAWIAPDLMPPSNSKPFRISLAEISTAHWWRASASKPWASSITQCLIGGRILPSAATFLNRREWFVITTSEDPARLRAPWTKHSWG